MNINSNLTKIKFMSSKSDKPLVRNLIIGCIIAVLIFHFAWAKQLFYNLGNPLFSVVDGLLIGLFIAEAIGSFRQADDPNKEWKRKLLAAITVALCIWAGGWAAGNNEKVSPGSPQMEDVR
jgi:hypothetical protein